MRALVLVLAVVLGGCAGPIAEMPEVVTAAADKLEQALDFADKAVGPSKFSALMICNSYGLDTPVCERTQNLISDAEEKVAKARDAVKAYRRAERSFEEANQAVNEALAHIEALGQSVKDVTTN